MAKRFTRNIRSIEDIEKQPKYTNEQNDLLSDDKHVYVRNKDQYENLTNSVKSVNDETIDENGNVEIDTGVHKVNQETPDDQGNVEIDTGVHKVNGKEPDEQGNIEVEYKQYTDDKVRDIVINDRNLLKGSSGKWQKVSFSGWNHYLIDRNDPIYVNEGETYTASLSVKDVKTVGNGVGLWFFGYSSDDEFIYESKESDLDRVKEGKVKNTITIPEKVDHIAVSIRNSVRDETVTLYYKEAKFQKGNRVTPWTPAPEDIALKSELEQIKQAIINLGGEI